MEARGSRTIVAQKTLKNGRRSNRERKMALIQDVKNVSFTSFKYLLLSSIYLRRLNLRYNWI